MYGANVDLRDYYVRQAGSGLRIFKGAKGQRGYNVFSSFFRKYGVDLLKFIGQKTYEPLKEIGQEIFVRKGDPREAIKTGLKRTARNIALGVLDKAKDRVGQYGSGKRRKRRQRKRKARKSKPKPRKARKSRKRSRKSGKNKSRRRAVNSFQPYRGVLGY